MSKTILLADDSVTIRKVVELTIMDEPYELVAVASGTEALDSLNESVDLVIADVHMPGSNGYEVCRSVKEQFPAKPVLLLVGTFESFDEGKAEAAGADGHLKKPFDSQDLLKRVRELLDKAERAGASAEAVPPALAMAPSTAADDSAGAGEADLEADPEESERAAPSGNDSELEEPEHQVEAVDRESTASSSATTPGSNGSETVALSDDAVARIARRVVELLSEEAIREVAWEVIPDLAEVVIKERLKELEGEVE